MRLIKWGYVSLLALALIWGAFRVDWNVLLDAQVRWAPLVFSVVLSLAGAYLQRFLWNHLLVNGGGSEWLSGKAVTRAFSIAWVGRYLPGKLPGIAAMAYAGTQVGASRQKSLRASIALPIIVALGMMLIALPAPILWVNAEPRVIAGFILAIAIGGTLAFFIAKGGWAMGLLEWLWSKTGREPLSDLKPLRRTTSIRAGILSVIVAVLFGSSQSMLFLSLAPSFSLRDYFFVLVMANLSATAGVAAIFAPGGVGVRELVLFATVGTLLRPETALLFALLSRLVTVLADVIFISLAWISSR